MTHDDANYSGDKLTFMKVWLTSDMCGQSTLSFKVICAPMNAIEVGICSFDQSVKQIVENDFEVDFEAKTSYHRLLSRPCLWNPKFGYQWMVTSPIINYHTITLGVIAVIPLTKISNTNLSIKSPMGTPHNSGPPNKWNVVFLVFLNLIIYSRF